MKKYSSKSHASNIKSKVHYSPSMKIISQEPKNKEKSLKLD